MEEHNPAILAEKAAEALMQKLSSLSLSAAFAESCTAGLVVSLLANTPGASRVLWGSFVCYTEEAKISMLGLDREKLSRHGLVSGETASLMVIGALEKSGADIAAAVTGLAGPDGDGSAAAVGTVWVAAARRGRGVTGVKEFHFTGSRNDIRLRAAAAVMETLHNALT